MINALVTILVLALLFGVVWWIVTALLPLPEPFARVAQGVIALIFLLLIIGVFFGGVELPRFR